MDDLTPPDKPALEGTPLMSEARLKAIVDYVWARFLYRTDEEQYGKPEHWQGALHQLIGTDVVQDDCDGFGRLISDLARLLGGFASRDIAELVTDTVPHDGKPIDHHICAVRVNGVWAYAHCWTPELLTKGQIEGGGYKLSGGRLARGMHIVSHRRIDRGNDSWYPGPPR